MDKLHLSIEKNILIILRGGGDKTKVVFFPPYPIVYQLCPQKEKKKTSKKNIALIDLPSN